MVKSGQARKKKNKITSDYGPPEKQQHGRYVEVETNVAGIKALRNVTIDPIQTYKLRKTITIEQWIAADTFAGQYRRAAMTAVYSQVNYDTMPSGEPPLEFFEAVQQSKVRVRDALRHVGSPLNNLIVHVCGDCRTAGSWSGVASSRRPDQDGMVALRLALNGLKDFYKIS